MYKYSFNYFAVRTVDKLLYDYRLHTLYKSTSWLYRMETEHKLICCLYIPAYVLYNLAKTRMGGSDLLSITGLE